jgi:hypothetical protein
MNNTFTINGKEYTAKPLTYNFLCDMEDNGISIDEVDKKPMKLGRMYLAFCGNMRPEAAGEEIEAHVIAGGNLNGFFDAMTTAINTCGFFRAMANQPDQETPKKK